MFSFKAIPEMSSFSFTPLFLSLSLMVMACDSGSDSSDGESSDSDASAEAEKENQSQSEKDGDEQGSERDNEGSEDGSKSSDSSGSTKSEEGSMGEADEDPSDESEGEETGETGDEMSGDSTDEDDSDTKDGGKDPGEDSDSAGDGDDSEGNESNGAGTESEGTDGDDTDGEDTDGSGGSEGEDPEPAPSCGGLTMATTPTCYEGYDLQSVSAGDDICRNDFGEAWFWVDFHETGAWYATGAPHSKHWNLEDRAWVWIRDKDAECFSSFPRDVGNGDSERYGMTWRANAPGEDGCARASCEDGTGLQDPEFYPHQFEMGERTPANTKCNAYVGDTPCTYCRPVLCGRWDG